VHIFALTTRGANTTVARVVSIGLRRAMILLILLLHPLHKLLHPLLAFLLRQPLCRLVVFLFIPGELQQRFCSDFLLQVRLYADSGQQPHSFPCVLRLHFLLHIPRVVNGLEFFYGELAELFMAQRNVVLRRILRLRVLLLPLTSRGMWRQLRLLPA